ncbi:hypothetical protein BG015_010226 [Linnemannia schmuckeri]|uniref:P-loop containing nucleoside triphosphate hydrolase protein n=1 Tax=Linnemannia schmuckeri TaxID=64567 RepID=A0A9P5V982_9FUNG|nr:hypothetical protein BG015_010226 [Linnemannia schmuckeri]
MADTYLAGILSRLCGNDASHTPWIDGNFTPCFHESIGRSNGSIPGRGRSPALRRPSLCILQAPPGDPTIGFQNASFSYAGKAEQAVMDRAHQAGIRLDGHHFQLKNLNLQFPVDELSIVTGPPGRGKPSMLLALLGEMNATRGCAFLPHRDNHAIDTATGLNNSIAYVAQQVWLLNDSIRNNILFGSAFVQTRYEQVVKMYVRRHDFEILEDSDEAEIGEQGVTLSGGQKQHVSLARAVYSRVGHILLDDYLSAVDVHTAKWLFIEYLMGPLMVGRALRLESCSGMVRSCGSPLEVLESGALNTDFLMDELAKDGDGDDKAVGVPGSSSSTGAAVQRGNVVDDSSVATVPVREKKKLIKVEGKAEGALTKEVYLTYFRTMGKNMFWTVLLSTLQVSSDAWLRVWAAAAKDEFNATSVFGSSAQIVLNPMQLIAKPMESLSYYLGVYAFLSVMYVASLILRESTQYMGSLRASRILHQKVLGRILHSPIRFFDTTPLGRITNRFTRDMDTVDQQVIIASANMMVDFLSTFTITGVTAYVTPQSPVPGLVISALFVTIAMFYNRTTRELKRHEATTNSPVYSHFAEPLNGVITIRAFGFEERFNTCYQELLDEHNRSYFYIWVCNRWLSIRVDVLSAFVSLFAGLFIVLQRHTIDAGAAGLSFTYSLAFTQHVLWFVRTLSYNEINMNCVERVQEYMTLPQEAPAIVESCRPPTGWPHQGEIRVQNLVMQYASDEPAVIRDISFHISPREKIGIVGRTGAGKSTLAVAFFRFTEMTSEKIEIDGVDISRIGVHDLRSNLTIIPQDPVLFFGTMRSNLDPFQEHGDAALWAVLKHIHLVSDISPNASTNSSTNNGTSSDTNNGFGNLDNENSKIIIDKAAASFDHATDAKIQATIRVSCHDATLLTIAHQLRTIIDFDRVIVMNHGKIVQMDTPGRLIREEGGVFRTICQRSGEFKLLLELATAAAKRRQNQS